MSMCCKAVAHVGRVQERERPVRDVCPGALVVSQGCNDIPQGAQGLVDLLAFFQPLACTLHADQKAAEQVNTHHTALHIIITV